MNVLVTGASGFVARYLIPELITHGHTVVLTSQEDGIFLADKLEIPIVGLDLRQETQVIDFVKITKFDAVVHLAGIAHVMMAASNRQMLADVNVKGTNNICLALHQLKRPCCFLFASSGLVFGRPGERQAPFHEGSAVFPVNAYGFSKLAAESVAKCYESDVFKVYIIRPSNHIGPGQAENFVCPSLARRIIAAKNDDVIAVGNLASERDFSDVRDVVSVYRLVLEQEPDQRLFVVGRGETIPIGKILDILVEVSGKNLSFREHSSLVRENEIQKIAFDTRLVQSVLGWRCRFTIENSLNEIYQSLQIG